ncbi:anthocyanidin 3-O-glucosyltransferase 6-like [Euphorbia lathyris]|uniref:anthocyanidin 3-O-glucosyltransferase 6-like n=1 Tax=Euphorbia lathyris TaxID=212925 RepID=UPI0033142F87
MNKKAELIFIPSPGVGHLASSVEAAKLLLDRDNRLSISVIIFNRSSDSKLTNYTDSLTTTDRFRLFNISVDSDSNLGFGFIQTKKPQVKEAVSDLISTSGLPLAGFVLDMFCTSMMDVAAEFGVPSYFFFTSSAAFLGFKFHLQFLHDEHQVDPTQYKDSDAVLDFPTLVKPLPARVLPTVVLQKEWLPFFLDHARAIRKARGIIVNTFTDLECHAVTALSEGKNPPVYPVGPILNLGSDESNGQKNVIIDWLDDQPALSVVFLCFGSMGSFNVEQVKEIACALEHSKHRFLWSLRRPSGDEKKMEYPTDYENLEEVLPIGFMDRTAEIGKIIGWAPQTEILRHPSIGGFVSHCGWNSTLESIRYGVPIATWPIYAEQQLNAFQLVEELELGVEIKMDYRKENDVIVKAEEIERGIRCVMEHDSKVRTNVKEMSEKSKTTLMEGGSSLSILRRFIEDVMDNVP